MIPYFGLICVSSKYLQLPVYSTAWFHDTLDTDIDVDVDTDVDVGIDVGDDLDLDP